MWEYHGKGTFLWDHVSVWHAKNWGKFDATAKVIHTLLEQDNACWRNQWRIMILRHTAALLKDKADIGSYSCSWVVYLYQLSTKIRDSYWVTAMIRQKTCCMLTALSSRLDLGKFICGTGRGSSETQADRKQGMVCVLSNCGNELVMFCPNELSLYTYTRLRLR